MGTLEYLMWPDNPKPMPSPQALAAARQLNVPGIPDVHVANCIDQHFASLRQERDDADDYIRSIWKRDLLPCPLSNRLFDRLTKRP